MEKENETNKDKRYNHFTGCSVFFGCFSPIKPPVLPGVNKNTLVYERTASNDKMVMVWRPHYQDRRRLFNNGKKYSKSQCTLYMEVPVPYRFRTEIPQKGDIWSVKSGYRIYLKKIMRREKGGNYRSVSMSRSHSYARKHSTAHKHNTIYGISQGKEYINDIR